MKIVGISLLMGMSTEEQPLRIPESATTQDILTWIALVSSVQEYFPGLNEAEFEKQTARRIERGAAC